MVEEFAEIIERCLKKGAIEEELFDTLIEDMEIENDDDYLQLLHFDIPAALKELMDSAGLYYTLYHKKDDIDSHEYIASCETESGRKIAVFFDVDIDFETGEAILVGVTAYADRTLPKGLLPYYHPV